MNLGIKTTLLNTVRYIHNLSKKDYDKYVMIFLGSVIIIIGGFLYYISSSCDALESEITRLQNSKKKARKILNDYTNIMAEEVRIQTILDQHKNFNLKIYFEQFCKDQKISAAPGWDFTTTSINQQVDEITLTATFKELTTENLVRILQEFDKTEIIYIKNLRIKTEKDKKITCEIALATIKTKSQG